MLAFISGGTNGIGADVAARLARKGAEVIVTGQDAERGQRFVESLPGDEHVFAQFDVRDEDGWRESIESHVGDRPLDFLYLNPGAMSTAMGSDDPIDLLERTSFDRVVGVNLAAVVTGLRTALPSLYRADAPKVVVTSSIGGLIPYQDDPVYAAAKAGVTALVRSIAPTLRAKGVVITAVCPGGTLTGLAPEHLIERRADGSIYFLLDGAPMQTPDRVGEVVESLVSSSEPGDVWVVDVRKPVYVAAPPELWPGKFFV